MAAQLSKKAELQLAKSLTTTAWCYWKTHDDVIKWKHCPRYWSFVRGIHRSLVNSSHKVQWRGALVFSMICAWINGWVNNREAGDLRRHRAHYDVIVMNNKNVATDLPFSKWHETFSHSNVSKNWHEKSWSLMFHNIKFFLLIVWKITKWREDLNMPEIILEVARPVSSGPFEPVSYRRWRLRVLWRVSNECHGRPLANGVYVILRIGLTFGRDCWY